MFEYAKDTVAEKHLGDVEYIEKMCYEFSKLLYDINTEHNKMYEGWMSRCRELESHCADLENQIAFLTAGKPAAAGNPEVESVCVEKPSLLRRLVVRIRRGFHHIGSGIKKGIKKLFVSIVRFTFRVLCKIAIKLGIKDMLKRTGLYQKLQCNGLIEKLSRREV